jgi:hypothetical protein
MHPLELKSSHGLALGLPAAEPSRYRGGVNGFVQMGGTSPLGLQGRSGSRVADHASIAHFLERPRQGYPPYGDLEDWRRPSPFER